MADTATIGHRPKFQTAILLYNAVALPARSALRTQVSDARRRWPSPLSGRTSLMTLSRMLVPDQDVLARSDAIVERSQAARRRRGGDRGRGRPARVRDGRADGLPRACRSRWCCRARPRTCRALLSYCHQNNLKVVARGAGTSLCGGALPAEDAVVIGLSRMNRMLESTSRTDHHASRPASPTSPSRDAVGGGRLLLRARSVEPARLHARPATSP